MSGVSVCPRCQAKFPATAEYGAGPGECPSCRAAAAPLYPPVSGAGPVRPARVAGVRVVAPPAGAPAPASGPPLGAAFAPPSAPPKPQPVAPTPAAKTPVAEPRPAETKPAPAFEKPAKPTEAAPKTAQVAETKSSAASASAPAASDAPPIKRAPLPPPRTRQEFVAQVLGAFTETIPRTPTTGAYKAAVILAAATMLILFAVYIGFLVAIGYAMWRFPNVVLLIGGSVLLLFLIKPLFAPRQKSKAPISLRREHEPLLFAFVDRICQTVGAPIPSEIIVDEDVNAAASFRGGFFGLLSNQLNLHIGMPLVVGLSMQQLAGVLAHEFGHFSQSVGMRLSWFVRVMNGWFARIVFERDMWDYRLEQLADSGAWQLAIVAKLLQGLIWSSRKILWVLMFAGHAVCSHLLRQMEFDADRYEARLAGCDTFAETSKRLRVLGIAHEKSLSDLGEFFREGRLGDDLPRLIATNAGRLPKSIMTPLEDMIRNAKTNWLDSHPCDTDRIKAAQKEPKQGVFEYPGQAALLFTDPASLSKIVTLAFYDNEFEGNFDRSKLRTTDELLARQDDEERDNQSLERFLFGRFTVVRPPCPPWDFDPGPSVAQLAPQLVACRETMMADAQLYNDALGAYVYNDTQIHSFDQAERLGEAGVPFDAKRYRLQWPSADAARQARAQAAMQQQPLIDRMARYEEAAAQRVQLALLMLHAPDLVGVPDVEHHRMHADALRSVARFVARNPGLFLDLRRAVDRMDSLGEHFEKHRNEERYVVAFVLSMKEAMLALHRMRSEAETEIYPFSHGSGQITLGAYLVPTFPEQGDLMGTHAVCSNTLSRLVSLMYRMWGRLARLVEITEGAIGLPPLSAEAAGVSVFPPPPPAA